MSVRTLVLPAPPERVFAILEDPTTLATFVVGSRTIRHFDPRWPEVGTRAHHSVGIGPLVIRDSTEVLAEDTPHRLVLEARVRPFGTATVEFRLADHPDGTELTVTERPRTGPMALPVVAAVVDVLMGIRNVELGRRLTRLVERREAQRARAGA